MRWYRNIRRLFDVFPLDPAYFQGQDSVAWKVDIDMLFETYPPIIIQVPDVPFLRYVYFGESKQQGKSKSGKPKFLPHGYGI